VRGEEHRETLTSINNLGFLLQAQRKYSEAEPYLREAMEKYRRVLGAEHPGTLNSVNNLAALYAQQDMQQQVLHLLAPIEDRARQTLTGTYAMRFARLLQNLGKARMMLANGDMQMWTSADANLIEAHEIIVAARGATHAATRESAGALATFYAAWDKADPGKGHDAKSAERKLKFE